MRVNFSRCELGPIYRNDDGTLDITIEIDDADIEQTIKSLSIQCGVEEKPTLQVCLDYHRTRRR